MNILKLLIFYAISAIILIGVVICYEAKITETNATIAAWEEVAGDYAKLTDDYVDLSKKKTKRIWELKRLLRDCENNKYYRVRSDL